MFKKPFKASSKNQLSGKDKKDLKQYLLSLMSPSSVQAFFNYNTKLISEKVSEPKISIYINEQQDPVFIFFPKDNNYVPTIYLLVQYPDIIPSLWLKEGVEHFVFKGANIMCPGVQRFPLQSNKGQIVSIRTATGTIVAVGYLEEVGNEGVACNVVHYMGDKLWEYGSKIMSTIKYEDPKSNTQLQVSSQTMSKQEEQSEKKQMPQIECEDKYIEQDESQQNQQSTSIRDQNLQKALLNAIKLYKIKQQLPMVTTTFFSKYVRNASPVALDVQRSSYKRVGTFFQKMAQKGYITLTRWKQKKGNAWAVASFDFANDTVKQHKPTISEVIKSQKQELKLQKFRLQCDVKLQTLYGLKPQIQWLRDYDKQPREPMKQYEQGELNFLITKFLGLNKIKKYNQMVEQKRKGKSIKVKKQFIDIEYLRYPYLNPVIDGEVKTHLNNFKLETQLTQSIDQPVLKQVISMQLQRFRRNILRFTNKIQQLVGQENGLVRDISKKQFTSIVVQAFKAHNKNVTTINNLEPFLTPDHKPYQQLQDLTHYIQLRYACGSVIRQTSNNKNQIYIQGNLIEEMVELLTTEQGIDPSLISVINKLPKKKKK